MDFTPASDPIAERDEEEAWFDDEAPSDRTATGSAGARNGAGRFEEENGQGDYDY